MLCPDGGWKENWLEELVLQRMLLKQSNGSKE